MITYSLDMTDNGVAEKTSSTSTENLDDSTNPRDTDQEDVSLLDSALGIGDGDADDVDEAGLSLLEDPQIDDPVRRVYRYPGRLSVVMSCPLCVGDRSNQSPR